MYEITIDYFAGYSEIMQRETFSEIQAIVAAIDTIINSIEISHDSYEPEESIPDLEYPQ